MAEKPLFKTKEAGKSLEKKIFKDINFRIDNLPNGSKKFKSSSRDRKIIVLEDKSEIQPKEGVNYDVRVIEDSDPKDPNKGTYIVRIVAEDGVPIQTKEKELPQILTPISIDEEAGMARILETELPFANKNTPRVPAPNDFKHFCLDKKTLLTLAKIARDIISGKPVMLSGETACSKTSSIEFLAMVTGNEIIRLNFNGQTDSSELIGKFVPNDGQMQVQFEQKLKDIKNLPPKALSIMENANAQGRGMNELECQLIGTIIGISPAEWRWQDGIIPQAMKNGYWVICDEINLGEGNVLERLNPVLEKNPSLIVSENGNQKIGPKGDFTVHPDFHMFATMNPPETNPNRKPLSGPFANRWTGGKAMELPGETEYNQMLQLMVFGEQPDLEINGIKYEGGIYDPVYPTLKEIPGMKLLLGKLAKFHDALYRKALSSEIGKDKREKYAFTRRDLMALLDFLKDVHQKDPRTRKIRTIMNDPKGIFILALEDQYLDKIPKDSDSDKEDFAKVTDILKAIGISRDQWTHEFKD